MAAVPGAVVLLAGAAGALFMGAGQTEPCTSYVEVDFDQLSLDTPCVRVKGMAHYGSTIKQTVPGNLFRETKKNHLHGFFPPMDTRGRAIPLFLQTQRPADRLASYEGLTVEGRLVPPTSRTLPPSTEVMLSKHSEYWFGDDLLMLEPDRIFSEEGIFDEATGTEQPSE